MEAKFLTPIQLWKDFNPIKEALEVSYVLRESEDGYVRKGVYFTSENTDDGKARIYAETFAPEDGKKKPVIIVVGDIKNNIDRDLLKYVASCGYLAASFDYSAISDKKDNYTKYPQSLSYAEYRTASGNLNRAEPSAIETCWFVWAKAARRLISVIAQNPYADMNNIGIIGIRHGSLIMWQVAAMDGRIKAGASIVGNEGMLYQGKSKYNYNLEMELDESRVNWRAAISSEAYARFINCPIMIATATNNSVSSFDRMEDIINLLSDNKSYSFIANARLTNQITDSAISTIRKWFNAKLKKGSFPSNPSLSYEAIGDKFQVKVNADDSKKIKSVVVYYSFGELDPSYRNWISLEIDKEDNYETYIDIYKTDLRHFVFANVTYSDNLIVSTLESSFIPDDLMIIPSPSLRQRIIYDSSKGIDSFTIKSNELVIDDDNPYVEKSAMGINGITTSEGSLITFKIGDIRCYGDDDSILQLDACSKTNATFEIILSCLEEGVINKYSASVIIDGDEDWHKLSFNVQDFKTSELIPMKNWIGIKKLEIKDAQNILFNNIIWV